MCVCFPPIIKRLLKEMDHILAMYSKGEPTVDLKRDTFSNEI